MTFRSGGGLGQGSGSNQTLRHSPPLSRSRLIQHMPCNSTLTVRLGVLTALRCVGATNFGGALRRPGAMPRSMASSTLVPYASTHNVATDSTSQCRETRVGSVLRVFCHCHPTPLSALKPSSIQNRSPYQHTPASSGGRSVITTHGSSWSSSQTTIIVPRRRLLVALKAVPDPAYACPGPGTRYRAGRRVPPSGQKTVLIDCRA